MQLKEEKQLESIDKIKILIESYDQLEDYFNGLSNDLSIKDKQFSDLYHTIKDAKLNSNNAYKFCREIKQISNKRAEIKKNIAIKDTFYQHKNKMENKSNRGLLNNEVHRKGKTLNYQYINRIYTEEDIREILGDK